MTRTFRDRSEAGRLLAGRLASADLRSPVVVLALPRGGVPIGREVAAALGATFDVLVARKLGAPQQPELGIGAIAEGGGRVVDDALQRQLRMSDQQLRAVEAAEEVELARRVERYRAGRARPELAGRHVVLVDDGLATGVTAHAALLSLERLAPERVVLAVPVCAPSTTDRLERLGHEVICLICPDPFHAVGEWYDDFSPVSDDEVVDLLAASSPPT